MKKAFKPEEIAELFVEYVNAGDAEGIASLFEEDAIVAGVGGHPPTRGKDAILASFTKILQSKPRFEGVVHSAPVVNGDIALTSTLVPGRFVTTEVARKQADGSWLWMIDQPMTVILSTGGE